MLQLHIRLLLLLRLMLDVSTAPFDTTPTPRNNTFLLQLLGTLTPTGSMPCLPCASSRGRTFCSMRIRVFKHHNQTEQNKQHKTEAKKHYGCFQISIFGLQQSSPENEIRITPDQNSKKKSTKFTMHVYRNRTYLPCCLTRVEMRCF